MVKEIISWLISTKFMWPRCSANKGSLIGLTNSSLSILHNSVSFSVRNERLHYFYIRQTALEIKTERSQIKTYKKTYHKTPKNSDTQWFVVITLKVEQGGFTLV